MGQAEGSAHVTASMSPAAQAAWSELQAGLAEVGAVACQTADPSAWWPDRRDLDSPATHGAIAACRRCPLRGPCAAYAIAADERFGVWGGLTPAERQRAGRRAAYGTPVVASALAFVHQVADRVTPRRGAVMT